MEITNINDFNNMIHSAEILVAKAQGIDAFEILQESSDLEFNGGYAIYSYGERYIPFWTEEKNFFYMYARQNEGAYSITSNKNLEDEVAYVRDA